MILNDMQMGWLEPTEKEQLLKLEDDIADKESKYHKLSAEENGLCNTDISTIETEGKSIEAALQDIAKNIKRIRVARASLCRDIIDRKKLLIDFFSEELKRKIMLEVPNLDALHEDLHKRFLSIGMVDRLSDDVLGIINDNYLRHPEWRKANLETSERRNFINIFGQTKRKLQEEIDIYSAKMRELGSLILNNVEPKKPSNAMTVAQVQALNSGRIIHEMNK